MFKLTISGDDKVRNIRVFHPEVMTVGQTVNLCEKTHHYIDRVLRLRAGDAIQLVCGDGMNYDAVLSSVTKQGATAMITNTQIANTTPSIPIFLYIALLKGEAMDWALQKSVELGVTMIVPLMTSRSERKLSGERLEKRLIHWQGILQSAALQCGRAEWPVIQLPKPFATLDAPAEVNLLFSPHDDAQGLPNKADSVAVLIGPEGGISVEEVLLAQQRGWQPQGLGNRILRADTAVVAALTWTQLRFGSETW